MTCRPLLTDGSAVFRRDRHHLQIGTTPGWVVNDQPGLLELLRMIDGATDTSQLQRACGAQLNVTAIIAELISAGIAVDASTWNGGPSREHQANLARGLDPSAVPRRGAYRVAIAHDEPAAPMAASLRWVLAQAGISVTGGDDCELLIICSLGEPARTLFTAACEYGIDQLPVVIDGPAIRCGPYIRPGRWPCLRCHDFLRADWDTAWPALLHQPKSRQPQIHQHSPAPAAGPAVSAVLMQLVAARAADDVISTAEERVPSTYACLRSYGPQLHQHTRYAIPFHPECTCTRLLAEVS